MFASVEIPDTLMVFVLILSVAATPVNADPSPAIEVKVAIPAFIFPLILTSLLALTTPVAVVIPDTVKLAAAIVSVAAIPVNADPSPEKDVAVTTPVTFKPALTVGDLLLP